MLEPIEPSTERSESENASAPNGSDDALHAPRSERSGRSDTWRREHTDIPDRTFPLNAFHIRESNPDMFCIPPHWHEHLEWIAIAQGRFSVQVGASLRELSAGDCAFVNAAQLHAAFPLEPGSSLHALVFGEALLRNHAIDHTETRYVRPLLEGRLGLRSFYEKETAKRIAPQLLSIVDEYRDAAPGYELLVKASLLAALGLALRESSADREREPSGRDDTGNTEKKASYIRCCCI
ncbi:cupin domain-containing protein [Saccharibacillus sacchari]|uniref:Cupin domain-containing protein n=1 Tax=Saccharibacillus sacchari TaxID=456493 RepID=A0ACC6PHI1_9BACL